MKSKIISLMFSGLLAGSLAVSGQDTPPATGNTETNAPVTGAADAATNAVAVPEPAPDSGASTSANQTAKTSAIIPLIVMDDVPLTDAIKNLARQANINYMLDPRISFGQIDPATGRPTPQPTVSIRWENVTAEQALLALLNNYGLQLVDDIKTKISRISVKDPAAPDPLVTKIIQLKYAGPTNLISAVQTALTDKRSKVMGDVRSSQLVVLATEKELLAVDQMVDRLDTPTRQVLIEARLLETTANPQTIKGIDWSGTVKAQHFAFGNNLQTAPVTAEESDNKPLATKWPKLMVDTAKGFNPATAFLDADGVSAVFSFLNQNSEAKVLSTPRTVTLDNENATLSVTRQFPIFNTTAGTANTPGGSSVTYSNLGVILNVTPRISANNFINLKVRPEVSRIFDTTTVFSGGQANTAYIFDSRTMETSVMIPSGNTLVLGGLSQDDTRNSNNKVPLLGDIPFLGRAFRMDSKSREKNTLLIFITPTIVQDFDFQPTKSDFLKTPPASEHTEKDWSAWDSGKPYDWSKLFHHN